MVLGGEREPVSARCGLKLLSGVGAQTASRMSGNAVGGLSRGGQCRAVLTVLAAQGPEGGVLGLPELARRLRVEEEALRGTLETLAALQLVRAEKGGPGGLIHYQLNARFDANEWGRATGSSSKPARGSGKAAGAAASDASDEAEAPDESEAHGELESGVGAGVRAQWSGGRASMDLQAVIERVGLAQARRRAVLLTRLSGALAAKLKVSRDDPLAQLPQGALREALGNAGQSQLVLMRGPPGADVDASTRKDSAHLAAGKVQFKSQRRTDPLESYLVTANGLIDLFSSPGGAAAGATAISQPKAKKQRSR